MIERSAAIPTTAPPANAIAKATIIGFRTIELICISLQHAKGVGCSSWQHRNSRRRHVARHRRHERDEIVLLPFRQAERPNLIGSARTTDPTAVVVVQDRLQGRHGTVMHVRSSVGNLAQSWRLEGVLHFDDSWKELAAPAVFVRKAGVMEAVVGEVPSAMAVGAGCFFVEQLKSALCRVGDRFLIALDPSVEGSGSGYHRAFVSRNRPGDALGCEPLPRKGG